MTYRQQPDFCPAELDDDESAIIAAELSEQLHASAAAHGFDATSTCDLDDMLGALRFAI